MHSLGDPALAGELEYMTSRGLLQPSCCVVKVPGIAPEYFDCLEKQDKDIFANGDGTW